MLRLPQKLAISVALRALSILCDAQLGQYLNGSLGRKCNGDIFGRVAIDFKTSRILVIQYSSLSTDQYPNRIVMRTVLLDVTSFSGNVKPWSWQPEVMKGPMAPFARVLVIVSIARKVWWKNKKQTKNHSQIFAHPVFFFIIIFWPAVVITLVSGKIAVQLISFWLSPSQLLALNCFFVAVLYLSSAAIHYLTVGGMISLYPLLAPTGMF